MVNQWHARASRRRRFTSFTTSVLIATAGLGVAAQADSAPAAAAPPVIPAAGAAEPSRPTPTPAVTNAIERDLDISADQIVARQMLEATAPDLEESLRQSLGDRFGGLWISPDGTINVGVTDGGHDPLVRAAGATPRTTVYSEKELDAAKAALDRHAEAAPDSVHGWGVDPRINRVVIDVDAGQAAAAEKFSIAAGVDPRMVHVADGAPRVVPASRELRAGERIYDAALGVPIWKCSAGFAVEGGFVTAGHCHKNGIVGIPMGPDLGLLGKWVDSSFPINDYAWVKTSEDYSPVPEVVGLGSVAGSREAAIGTAVCRSGATTGVHCGRIKRKNVTKKTTGGTVYGLTETDACGEEGDSGGPFMAGDQAQGVASAIGTGTNCDSGGLTYFQPLNPILSAYGLTLKTVPSPPPWWDAVPGNSDRGTLHMDVNGDDLDDIVVFYDYGGTRTRMLVFTNNGSGGFNDPVIAWDSVADDREEGGPGGWDLTRSRLVGGKFNLDARADVAAIYDYGDGRTKLWVFLANSEGGFDPPKLTWDSEVDGGERWEISKLRLVSGRFDLNASYDIALFYDYGNAQTKIHVFSSMGNGSFSKPTVRWDTGPGNWYLAATRLVAGNFDGLRTDQIAAFYDYGNAHTKMHVLTPDSSGRFTVSERWDTGPGNWYLNATRLVAGNFDNAGWDEIGALYDYGGAHTKLWVLAREPSGKFKATEQWETYEWYVPATRLVGGYFDGDYRSDIAAFYYYGGNHTKLWLFSPDQSGRFAFNGTLKWDSQPGNWSLDLTAPV